MGAMCFRSLFDIKSTPELNFGFICLQIFKMSVTDIFEKLKLTGLLSDRKLSNWTSDSSMFEASFGPTVEKKLLNPLAISKYSVIILPLSLKKSGSWALLFLDPIISLITDQVCLQLRVNLEN